MNQWMLIREKFEPFFPNKCTVYCRLVGQWFNWDSHRSSDKQPVLCVTRQSDSYQVCVTDWGVSINHRIPFRWVTAVFFSLLTQFENWNGDTLGLDSEILGSAPKSGAIFSFTFVEAEVSGRVQGPQSWEPRFECQSWRSIVDMNGSWSHIYPFQWFIAFQQLSFVLSESFVLDRGSWHEIGVLSETPELVTISVARQQAGIPSKTNAVLKMDGRHSRPIGLNDHTEKVMLARLL